LQHTDIVGAPLLTDQTVAAAGIEPTLDPIARHPA
jgi:hypothetical protein